MAYWKENINVEVLLPFDTPNCTTSWYWVVFSISLEETWISGGVWIYNAGTYTNHSINICGRIACKSGGHIESTTHHLMACRAHSDTEDPSRSDNEHFKVRLVSRDKKTLPRRAAQHAAALYRLRNPQGIQKQETINPRKQYDYNSNISAPCQREQQ